jgi:hypothetical protein
MSFHNARTKFSGAVDEIPTLPAADWGKVVVSVKEVSSECATYVSY